MGEYTLLQDRSASGGIVWFPTAEDGQKASYGKIGPKTMR